MNSSEIVFAAKHMSCTELESLISALMEVRFHMSPPVSEAPPRADGTVEQQITVEDDPSISMRRLRDGRVRMWIRCSGIGWLAFNLSQRQYLPVREWLIANTDINATPDLIGKSDSGGHTH